MAHNEKTTGVREHQTRRVIEMTPLDIVGKVQKPHVFYVIERGDIRARFNQLLDGRNHLLEIENSVKKAPF